MFKWMKPKLRIEGEIYFPAPEPQLVEIRMLPPLEEEQTQVKEYPPLRLVKDEEA